MLQDLPLVLQFVLFVALFYLIVRSSSKIIDSASELAKIFGVSELIIGLTIVAIGTSAPEFAVSSFASLNASSGVALGNVIGSNIFNVGIVLALFAIVKPITISRELFFRDTLFLLLASSAFVFFSWTDATFTRMEGIIFFTSLLAYLFFLYRSVKKAKSKNKDTNQKSKVDKKVWFILLNLVISLAVLLICSKWVVDLAIGFARKLEISEWLIGSTIVAAGTSLPELVTAISSIAKKKLDIGVGNIIGSELFNILGVVGFASIISPLTGIDSMIPFFMLLATTLFLVIAMRTGWKLTRLEGIILIAFAIFRWINTQ